MVKGRLKWKSEEFYEVETPKDVYNWKVYAIGLMGLSAAMDYGYDLGFIGTTQSLKPYQEYFDLVDNKSYATDYKSNVVMMFQVGAIVGSLFSGPIAAAIGRKTVNVSVAVLFILGSLLQSIAGVGSSDPHGMMLAGRFLNGISVGGSNTIAPLIVSEMSPPAIRGRLVGLYEIGVQTGTLLGFWINYGLTRHHAENEMEWRIPFLLQFLFGGIYVIMAICVPESPRVFAKQGRDEVVQRLGRIRNLENNHPYLQAEVDGIMAQYESESEVTGWKGLRQEFKLKSIQRRFVLITILFIFFQFSGTNSVNYYSPTIFERLGITGEQSSFLATGVYGLVRFAAIVVAMLFSVDVFGRRLNLIVFGTLMSLCLWIIGALVKHDVGGLASIVLIYIYAAAFCFSYAGIPYIINSEMWPHRIRPYGVSWGVFVHWVFNLVIGKSTPYMLESLDYGFFFLYAGFLAFGSLFVFFFIPETKNVPLEQMETIFSGPLIVGPKGRPANLDQAQDSEESIDHPDKKTDTRVVEL